MKKLAFGVAVALCALQAHAQSHGTERKVQGCGTWSRTAIDPAEIRRAGGPAQAELLVDPATHTVPFHHYVRTALYEQTVYAPEPEWELTGANCADRLDDPARERGNTE